MRAINTVSPKGATMSLPSIREAGILTNLHVTGRDEWRAWLQVNHEKESVVWLVFYKKHAGKHGISYEDAVDEALCFGWVDSLVKRIDEDRYAQKFTPRKPGSKWSKLNRERMRKLRNQGSMTRFGLEAYKNRSMERPFAETFKTRKPQMPDDFEKALRKNKKAWKNFQKFGLSHRRNYLMWIAAAKKEETRRNRINEAIALIANNVKSLLK
jgi:uncharacterized protein YdeI (YjbR/CyaY-like superfamily)